MKAISVVIAVATVVVGTFLPWASVDFAGLGAINTPGPVQEMGLVLAAIAALAAFPGLSGTGKPVVPAVVVGLFGAVILTLAAWSLDEILNLDQLSLGNEQVITNPQPGIGLFVTFGGGILMIMSSLLLLTSRVYPPPPPRSGVETAISPGWYPNPDRSRSLRYWTGSSWTSHVVRTTADRDR